MLPRSNTEVDGRVCRVEQWEGLNILVRDDADTALRLCELLNERITLAAKAEGAVRLLFAHPEAVVERVSDLAGLVGKCLESLKRGGGERLIDWDEDADRIRASVWHVYGVSADELMKRVSLDDFCAMLAMCPRETPIGQALFYRTAKPPKETKHNREQVEEFRRLRRYYALGATTEMNAKADDFAAALVRRANG